ncbi:hypothetical protein MP638_003227 [Amoeboaphelidium occidentale]|nr:hypothetical protein MP638_003227 [Amoeboaphelidium occidentale]
MASSMQHIPELLHNSKTPFQSKAGSNKTPGKNLLRKKGLRDITNQTPVAPSDRIKTNVLKKAPGSTKPLTISKQGVAHGSTIKAESKVQAETTKKASVNFGDDYEIEYFAPPTYDLADAPPFDTDLFKISDIVEKSKNKRVSFAVADDFIGTSDGVSTGDHYKKATLDDLIDDIVEDLQDIDAVIPEVPYSFEEEPLQEYQPELAFDI